MRMLKRESSLAKHMLRILLPINFRAKMFYGILINKTTTSYYTDKCKAKKNVTIVAVMHTVCNIIFTMLWNNKPSEIMLAQEHCKRYAA